MADWWTGMTYSEYEQEEARRRAAADREYKERQRDKKRRQTAPLYELIGRAVVSLAAATDGGYLHVVTDDGEFVYDVQRDDDLDEERAWWASTHGVQNLIGERVVTCTTFRPESRIVRHRRERNIREHGIRLTTAKGQTDIVIQSYGPDLIRITRVSDDGGASDGYPSSGGF